MALDLKALVASSNRPIGTSAWFSGRPEQTLVYDTATYLKSGEVLVGQEANYPDAYANLKWYTNITASAGGATPVSRSFGFMAYGAGVFVLFPNDSTSVYFTSSDNGATWVGRTSPQTGTTFVGVAYGGGVFVCLTNGGLTYTSPDGITWTNKATIPTYTYAGIFWAERFKMFIATTSTGSGTYTIYASRNVCNSWTQYTMTIPTSTSASDCIFSNDYDSGLAYSRIGTNTSAHYTTNGTFWNATNIPACGASRSIAYGNGVFVMVGYAGFVATSKNPVNGANWNISSFLNLNYSCITFSNGVFVALAGAAACIVSVDGINWKLRSLPTSLNWNTVAGNTDVPGLFVGAANGSASTFTSTGTDYGIGIPVNGKYSDEVVKYMRIK